MPALIAPTHAAFPFKHTTLLLFILAITTITPSASEQYSKTLATCTSSLCFFPPDGVSFLLGSYFDLHVELYSDNATSATQLDLKNDLSILITKNGRLIADQDYFTSKAVQIQDRSWEHAYYHDAREFWTKNSAKKPSKNPNMDLSKVHVQAKTFRRVFLDDVGEYEVTMKSGPYSTTSKWKVRQQAKRTARNVILFIGDGMTTPQLSAARLVSRSSKRKNGLYGKNTLHMEQLPVLSHVMPNGIDSMITDSANSASAYMTGMKTFTSALGVWSDTTTSDPLDDPKMETIAEMIRRKKPNMGVGIVTTADVHDATPASVFSHTRDRDTRKEIVRTLLKGPEGNTWSDLAVKADVVLGGGSAIFREPINMEGRNTTLLDEFTREYSLVMNKTSLLNHQYDGKPLLGLFNKFTLDSWVDRHVTKETAIKGAGNSPLHDGSDAIDQPDLADMALKAIEVLEQRSTDGWFLLVEAALVDKMMHIHDFHRGIGEIIELDNTVKTIMDWDKTQSKNPGQTLMIVTADHGHGFDVFGSVDTELLNDPLTTYPEDVRKRLAVGVYESAGWPDFVDANGDNFPDNWRPRFNLAMGTNNGPSIREDYQLSDKPRKLTVKDPLNTKWHVNNPADAVNGIPFTPNLPPVFSNGVHTMQDVPLFATGPSSNKLGRVIDNVEVFFVMAEALGLGESLDKEQAQRKSNSTISGGNRSRLRVKPN